MTFAVGAREVRLMGGYSFWARHTTELTYTAVPFSASLNTLVITNDSTTATVSISWDGVILGGELKPQESITINTDGKTAIWIKSATASEYVRIWGW